MFREFVLVLLFSDVEGCLGVLVVNSSLHVSEG